VSVYRSGSLILRWWVRLEQFVRCLLADKPIDDEVVDRLNDALGLALGGEDDAALREWPMLAEGLSNARHHLGWAEVSAGLVWRFDVDLSPPLGVGFDDQVAVPMQPAGGWQAVRPELP